MSDAGTVIDSVCCVGDKEEALNTGTWYREFPWTWAVYGESTDSPSTENATVVLEERPSFAPAVLQYTETDMPTHNAEHDSRTQSFFRERTRKVESQCRCHVRSTRRRSQKLG